MADGLLELYEEVVKVPRVVEDGGRLRVEEAEVRVRRAALRTSPQWMRDWAERQRAYVEHQLKEWAHRLDLVLPPWLRG